MNQTVHPDRPFDVPWPVSDEWVEGARTTVRSHPLTSIATALALGAVMARITR